MHTTNYYETFIEVSPDCPVSAAEIPELKNGSKTVAFLQYELFINNPYVYTSDDVIFSVYAQQNHIATAILTAEREFFFSQGQACLRSSPLVKRYGWGVHSNEDGRVAIYALGSKDYQVFYDDAALKHIQGLRSKRK